MNINAYIEKAREDRASDLHLVCALPPKYRVDGEIRDLEPTPLTAQQCGEMARELAGKASSSWRRWASWIWPSPSPGCAAV